MNDQTHICKFGMLRIGLLWLTAVVIACHDSEPPAPEPKPKTYQVHFEGNDLNLKTNDSLLAARFEWAANKALSYAHQGDDPVGLWYEAALPNREAFCMRDVSHQSVGAHYLGLSGHTKNMLLKFAENISPTRDWCSYWEINRYDQPAPVDYRSDQEFWYNLPANFDVLIACWKQYLLTADRDYLENPDFQQFYDHSMTDYVDRWDLEPQRVMNRERFVNLPESFDRSNSFQVSRGLPGYGEEDPINLYLGADLLCLQYQAYTTYANMLEYSGNDSSSLEMMEKAKQLISLFNTEWWDSTGNQYYSAKLMDGKFVSKPNRYLLQSGIAQTIDRQRRALQDLLDREEVNVESQSYLPAIYYQYDENHQAYEELMDLSDPEKPRRDYPEVSFAVVEAVVEGLAGVQGDAVDKSVLTLPRLKDNDTWVEFNNLPMFQGTIDLAHYGNSQSWLENHTSIPIIWRITFPVGSQTLVVNEVEEQARVGTTISGMEISQVEFVVEVGKRVEARVP